jgi:hypothetical protein
VIQVKYAHRIDAPGCLEVLGNEVVNITNSSLHLNSQCVLTGTPVTFLLDFDFHWEIDVENSIWRQESVGRLFFNITKKYKG